jgi:ATP-binding cassette subfamily B protein/subfamily B ATP-binding cassette protein MsbA
VFNIFFREPMQGVRYLESPSAKDPAVLEKTLEASATWKIERLEPASGQAIPPFEVRGDTVRVAPDVRVIPVASGLEASALEAERDHKAYAFALRWLADTLPKDRYRCFVGVLLGILVMSILRGGLIYASDNLVGYTTNRALMGIRVRLFDHVLRSSLASYSTIGPTDIMSRFTQDSFQILEGMKTVLGKVVAEPMRILVCVVAAIWCGAQVDWRLPVVVLVTGPAVLFLVRQFSKLMRRASRKALETRALMMSSLEESFFGIRVVKGYLLEGHVRRQFFQRVRRLLKQLMRTIRVDAVTTPAVEVIFTTAVVVAAIYGGAIIIPSGLGHGRLDALLAFFAFLAGALDPMRKLANVSNRVQEAASASDRVFALFKLEPEVRHGTKGTALPRMSRTLEFRNVSFSYPTGDVVLRHINLSIRYGEVLAIVGRTGCGKTTLVSLVPRFFAPSEGEIFIDGTDLREVTLLSLREQIAIVPQDAMLFADTAAHNIALGAGERRCAFVPREAVVAAATAARADRFLSALPSGYDTVVGEHGTSLSGGERQRLALARAIIRDPAILILDEATSSLDEETQAMIQDTLREFTKGRTTVLIAHRLSTLNIADRIAVMDAGQIIDIGTHDELMARCTLYRRLREVGLDGA